MASNEENNLGKLTEESLKRKERLKKLREQAQSKSTDVTEPAEKLPKYVHVKCAKRLFTFFNSNIKLFSGQFFVVINRLMKTQKAMYDPKNLPATLRPL